MSKYKFDQLTGFKKEYLKEGVYVVLLNALTVPPHLLLIVSGKVFSISTLGPALDQDFDKYYHLILRKRIPSVFVKLSLPDIFTKEDLLEKVRSVTSAYPRVDIDIATCLTPIKDFCEDVYSVDKTKVNLVFDLLDGLKAQNAIEEYYQMNLEDHLIQGTLDIDVYSVFEVNEAIHSVTIS